MPVQRMSTVTKLEVSSSRTKKKPKKKLSGQKRVVKIDSAIPRTQTRCQSIRVTNARSGADFVSTVGCLREIWACSTTKTSSSSGMLRRARGDRASLHPRAPPSLGRRAMTSAWLIFGGKQRKKAKTKNPNISSCAAMRTSSRRQIRGKMRHLPLLQCPGAGPVPVVLATVSAGAQKQAPTMMCLRQAARRYAVCILDESCRELPRCERERPRAYES